MRLIPKVLVVCGYGRSGSTLLDRVLGQMDGCFSAGEVRHIWHEGLVENRLCGCGTPFANCPLWASILECAFEGSPDVEEILRLQSRVDRWFRIPQIAASFPSSFGEALDTYLDVLRRLYDSIAAVTGAGTIVDSSKDVSHAWLLTRLTGVDVYAVQLVRDSRATAYSWQRTKFNPGSGRNMDRYGWVRGALQWNAINVLAGLIGHTGTPFTVLRYEDFVAEPRAALERLLEFLDEDPRRDPFDSKAVIRLRTNHTVAGNPLRFEKGAVHIRPDEEWRMVMSRPARAVVGSLTWPLLRRFGFTDQRTRP